MTVVIWGMCAAPWGGDWVREEQSWLPVLPSRDCESELPRRERGVPDSWWWSRAPEGGGKEYWGARGWHW